MSNQKVCFISCGEIAAEHRDSILKCLKKEIETIVNANSISVFVLETNTELDRLANTVIEDLRKKGVEVVTEFSIAATDQQKAENIKNCTTSICYLKDDDDKEYPLLDTAIMTGLTIIPLLYTEQ